ncbi:YqcI/YcgG family protein [Staphylococcus sp. 30400_3112M30941]|nr:YqcI/YcgG family protein [Staphylococcus sp. 30403_3112M30944]MBO0945482.1 YqcI/YcgG family protein [Staphylococcus sp. 30402_3112M30943]MBO0963768.1 YqcI/YcgG family protein [Staphylococcus sp. 30400_3112M30941]MBO0967543.1 YqcI/YcgG family protein [Staphylococcus sp. 30401_3112M30942]
MFFFQNNLNQLPKDYKWLETETHKSIEVIESKGFPYVFGVQGHKKEVHFYSALNYPYDPKELSSDIDQYLNELKKMKKNEQGISGLLVYFEPIGNMNIHAKQFLAWQVLSTMKNLYGNKNDSFDNDPFTDEYAFKFKDELWFINFSSNSYTHRKSRNLGSFITLAMQTLSKSDEYFNSNIETKAKAQKLVRNLAEKYDGCPVHSGLGPVIGSGKFSPAKLSYFIGDKNDDPSYEPWKYSPFKPQRIIIDEAIVKDYALQFDQFYQLYNNKTFLTLTESHNNNDINKNNVLITNNPSHIEKYKNKIKVATFNNRYETDKNICKIDYINDLIALRYLK